MMQGSARTQERPRGVCLVTGATGFIGTGLVSGLRNLGVDVRAVIRGTSGKVVDNFESISGDILDLQSMRLAMRNVSTVFHLAGVGSPASSSESADQVVRVNVCGTANVLRAAKEAGVRRVVIASSAAVYGQVDSPVISETMAPAPATAYGVSKLAQEHLSALASEFDGLETVALRMFNVYGPGEDLSSRNRKLIASVIRTLKDGLPVIVYGDGSQTRDFVHLTDVVDAFVRASVVPVSGHATFNIGTGEGTRIIDVIQSIARAHEIDAEIDFRPQRPGDIERSVADISAARGTLQFRPKISFDCGISSWIASSDHSMPR